MAGILSCPRCQFRCDHTTACLPLHLKYWTKLWQLCDGSVSVKPGQLCELWYPDSFSKTGTRLENQMRTLRARRMKKIHTHLNRSLLFGRGSTLCQATKKEENFATRRLSITSETTTNHTLKSVTHLNRSEANFERCFSHTKFGHTLKSVTFYGNKLPTRCTEGKNTYG